MNIIPILFTYWDLKEKYPNKNGFYSFVDRSLKNGTIKQIKRGLYALIDQWTGNIYATKFQIAIRLFEDSYFSYHETLEYYGLSTQCFVSQFTYLTHVHVPELEFEDILYHSKVRTCNLEIVNRMKETGVRVVSLERAIVDSIDNIHLGGELEEIELALDSCPRLELDKVVSLLEHYDKAFLYQKVGYLFEKHFENTIPRSFYDLGLSKISTRKTYLDCITGRAKTYRNGVFS